MAKRRSIRWFRIALALLVLAAVGVIGWADRELAPTSGTASKPYVRVPAGDLASVSNELGRRGIVRNPTVFALYARLMRAPGRFASATYAVKPGMDRDEILRALRSPMRQLLRLPETNWARRSANLLEKADVCTAKEYMDLVRQPEVFRDEVSFPIEGKTLEGYLYPDTYDLPPLLGAKEVIRRQLRAFERKAWDEMGRPKNLHRALIIASMVELEVAKDNERPMVAAVIENRLRIGMRLQIDATINYALQKWRPLAVSEYQSVVSPYNTYRVDGLPPGPICSPSIKSIRAALAPDTHRYLYYVAMPDGFHLFSETYDEHLRNVARRRAAMRNLR